MCFIDDQEGLHALLVDGLFPAGEGTFLDVGANELSARVEKLKAEVASDLDDLQNRLRDMAELID